MKKSLLVGIGSMALTGFSAVWNPNGTGGWSAPGQWLEGQVPGAGETVYVTNGTVKVTNADLANVNLVAGIVLEETGNGVSEVEVDCNAVTNLTFPVMSGKGVFVKRGAGVFGFKTAALDNGTAKLPSRGVLIENGELAFVSCNAPKVTVNAPGVLRPRTDAHFYCYYGLWGNGHVASTTDGDKWFICRTDSAEKPAVFSGTFDRVNITTEGGCCQYFTNPAAIPGNGGDIRIWGKINGIAKFGMVGQPGSLGGSKIYWLRGSPCTMLYLGEGETTDHDLYWNSESGVVTFDMDATGGVTFTGELRPNGGTGTVNRHLVLTGSNTVAAAFARTGSTQTIIGGDQAMYITKRGTGTWNFTSPKFGNHGAMAIEEGTLGFDSIAKVGVNCSLGYGDRLYDSNRVMMSAATPVDYAYLLGNGAAYATDAAIPTFKYIGSVSAASSGRLLEVKGAGRIENGSNASFSFDGVTSGTTGDNTLVLKAAGEANTIRNITNGVGRLTVVKEGAGTWNLADNTDVEGVNVRSGILNIKGDEPFTYFRFIAKESYYKDYHTAALIWYDAQPEPKPTGTADKRSHDGNNQLGQFGFWDADGNKRSDDLVYRNCVGDATLLQPGEVTDYVTFGSSGPCTINPRGGRYVENLFTNVEDTVRFGKDVIWSGAHTSYAQLDNPDTWVGFICRLTNGTAVAKYDLRAVNGWASDVGSINYREIKSWSLEGSRDGVEWVVIDNVISNTNVVTQTQMATIKSYRVWYSSNSRDTSTGFDVDTVGAYSHLPNAITAQVAAGATLQAEFKAPVDALVYDVADGAGTIRNCELAANGRLYLKGVDPAAIAAFKWTFVNCDGVENLANWKVTVNGVEKNGWRITFDDQGNIVVRRPGTVIICN